MATGTAAQQIIEVVTPAAGESVTEGTILEWHVKIGDFIKVDDTIVEISTDKVDVELPSPASGVVTEILVEEGETVSVGQTIARLSVGEERSDGGSANQTRTSGEEGNSSSAPETPTSVSSDGEGSAQAQPIGDGALRVPDGTRVSPVAARVAATEGVNLAGLSGSGPGGRIVKADVLGATANGGATSTQTPPNGAATEVRT